MWAMSWRRSRLRAAVTASVSSDKGPPRGAMRVASGTLIRLQQRRRGGWRRPPAVRASPDGAPSSDATVASGWAAPHAPGVADALGGTLRGVGQPAQRGDGAVVALACGEVDAADARHRRASMAPARHASSVVASVAAPASATNVVSAVMP